jgi:hypothetical protein
VNQFEALLGILAYGVVLSLVALVWIAINHKSRKTAQLSFPKEPQERIAALSSSSHPR